MNRLSNISTAFELVPVENKNWMRRWIIRIMQSDELIEIFERKGIPFTSTRSSRIFEDSIGILETYVKHSFCTVLPLAVLWMYSDEDDEILEYILKSVAPLLSEELGDISQDDIKMFVNFIKKEHFDDMYKMIDLPYALSFSFGTENCVNIRRELVILREKLMGVDKTLSYHSNYLSSGSLSEGLAYPPSDDDIMDIQRKGITEIIYDVKPEADFSMIYSECSPGYCLILELKKSSESDIDRFICTINDQRFLSSTLFKENKRKDIFKSRDVTIHGPCFNLSRGIIEVDYAVCLECPFWPQVAREWIDRARPYEWPSREQIQHIVRMGCHVVPIGDPESQHGDHEWRISFSLAERTLIHSFNHSQFLTYNALRNALKKIIDQHFPDVLCSYIIKTTMFHTIENTHKNMWRLDNLEDCYNKCLSVLHDFIDDAYCPSYFILDYNLIKRKINDVNKQPLLDLIQSLIEKRLLGFDKNRYIAVPLKHIERLHDKEFFTSYLLHDTISTLRTQVLNFSDNILNLSEISRFLAFLQKLKTENELINIVINGAANDLSNKIVNAVLSRQKRNKEMYKHFSTLKAYLRIQEEIELGKCVFKHHTSSLRADHTQRIATINWHRKLETFKRDTHQIGRQKVKADTLQHKKRYMIPSKLTKATYLYQVGKTDESISVSLHVLSIYPPYAVGKPSSLNNVETYIDVICGRGYTLEIKARCAWVRYYRLNSQYLYSYPRPLFIWLLTSEIIDIHPVTYAILLKSLCYIQINNNISLIKSMDEMMYHSNMLRDDEEILNTLMCMGIIRFTQGDNYTAYGWFKSAYKMLQVINENLKKNICVKTSVPKQAQHAQRIQKATFENGEIEQTEGEKKSKMKNEKLQEQRKVFIKNFRRALLFYITSLVRMELFPYSIKKKTMGMSLQLPID